MAKKDWGPLTEAKKKDEITAAFNVCVAGGTALELEPIKTAVYDRLAERYKFNQAKFSSSERFWANANYAKFIVHLTDLIAVEKTRREQIEAKVKKEQERKGFGSRFSLNPSVEKYTLATGSGGDGSGADGAGADGAGGTDRSALDRWSDAGEKESGTSSNWWIWAVGGIVVLYFLLKK